MSWDIGIHYNGIKFEDASWNYTHNCNEMMREAGYDWVYHLDGQLLVETLPRFEAMLANLKADPERYRALNPANGWGDYDRLVALWDTILPRAHDIQAHVADARWWEWS